MTYHSKYRTTLCSCDNYNMLLLQHGVSQEDVFRGVKQETFFDIVYKIASQANTNLEHVRSIFHCVESVTCFNFVGSKFHVFFVWSYICY